MIYFLRSATIAPGKVPAALAYAREVAELVKAKTGHDVSIGMPVGGHASRIGWFVEYKDLATLDQVQTKLLQDPDYISITSKGGEHFVAGSLYDEIWRVL